MSESDSPGSADARAAALPPRERPDNPFYVPRSLLRHYLGGPVRQFITGAIVSLLLILPVEFRAFTLEPKDITDEVFVSLLAFFLGLLMGAGTGFVLPVVAARRGWLDDLIMSGQDPRPVFLALRRDALRFMWPHWLAFALVRIGFVGLQLLIPAAIDFSALLVILPQAGWQMIFNYSLLTAWAWLLLLAVPFAFEGAFWMATAALMHARRGESEDIAASLSRLPPPPLFIVYCCNTLLFYAMAFAATWGIASLVGLMAGFFLGLILSVVPVWNTLHALGSEILYSLIAAVVMLFAAIPSLLIARAIGLRLAVEVARRFIGRMPESPRPEAGQR